MKLLLQIKVTSQLFRRQTDTQSMLSTAVNGATSRLSKLVIATEISFTHICSQVFLF